MKTADLIAEVAALPIEDRALIADGVLKSLNIPDPEIDKQWAVVAQRRLHELESGLVQAVPAEEVFDRIRKRLAA